jgi:hypothetical protein
LREPNITELAGLQEASARLLQQEASARLLQHDAGKRRAKICSFFFVRHHDSARRRKS